MNTTPLGFAPLLPSADMLFRRPGDPLFAPPVGDVFGEVLRAERAPEGLRGVRARSRRGVLTPAREAAAALRAASRKPPRALFGGDADFGGELALGAEAALSGRGGEGILVLLGGEPAFSTAALRSSSRGTANQQSKILQACGIISNGVCIVPDSDMACTFPVCMPKSFRSPLVILGMLDGLMALPPMSAHAQAAWQSRLHCGLSHRPICRVAAYNDGRVHLFSGNPPAMGVTSFPVFTGTGIALMSPPCVARLCLMGS